MSAESSDAAATLLKRSDASFFKALQLCPDNPIVYNFRGILLRRMGRVEEAQASYVSALTFFPEFTEVREARCCPSCWPSAMTPCPSRF